MLILSVKNPSTLNSQALEHIDVIELRADCLPDTSKEALTHVITQLKTFQKPILFSLFSKREGGAFQNNEEELFERLHWASELGCEYISMEIHWGKANQRKLIKKIKGQGAKSITTLHHSEKTYTKDGLRHAARRCLYTKADIIRLAFQADSIKDTLKIFELIDFVNKKYKTPIIAYAQGERGKLSHAIGEMCGSFGTFVSSEEEMEKEFLTMKEIQEIKKVL